MFRLSHFAAPVVMGTALFLGVQGCTHDRADEIPASATELSTGTETVSATAPRDGMVYVWDQTANRMLYTAKVEKGDTVKVDAKHNKIWLDEKLVTKRDDLTNDHHFKIFFDQAELDRERARRASDSQSQTTVIVPDRSDRTTVVVPESKDRTIVVPPADSDSDRTTIKRETTITKERTD